MTNSATSTSRQTASAGTGFQAWHFFVLLSMAGATAAVMVSGETHPAALLLLSAAVICAGMVGLAASRAVAGFFDRTADAAPRPAHARDRLVREKALVLRSIKELEFDRAMGKVGDLDFGVISGRLRAHALALMEDLDRQPAPPVTAAPAPAKASSKPYCAACGTRNDPDARFCKACGDALTLSSPEGRT